MSLPNVNNLVDLINKTRLTEYDKLVKDTYLTSLDIIGNNIQYTYGNKQTKTFTLPVFKGAISDTNGTAGLVPAPPTEDSQNKYLRGDGTWAIVSGSEEIAVSETEPTSEDIKMWVNLTGDSGVSIPEVKDDEISEHDTWSSKKINDMIPTSLPANGGNADTVDGKHASDFVSSSTLQQVNNSRVELPSNVNVVEWLVQNAKIGTQYFRTDGAVGQTNLPGGLNTWMWFSYDGNRCLARAWTSNNGTTDFILDYVNTAGGWKEISTTPIKSTTFSGTTNEYGNVVFTAVGSKIPLFAECSPYCGIPLRFYDNYWIHCIDPVTNNNRIVANTAVTGTVYYAEI